MLRNNFACSWSDFKEDSLKISNPTISKYLNILINKDYASKVSKEHYMITQLGRKRLKQLDRNRNK